MMLQGCKVGRLESTGRIRGDDIIRRSRTASGVNSIPPAWPVDKQQTRLAGRQLAASVITTCGTLHNWPRLNDRSLE